MSIREFDGQVHGRSDFLDAINFESDRALFDAMIEAAAIRVREMLIEEVPEPPKLVRQRRRRSPRFSIRRPSFI